MPPLIEIHHDTVRLTGDRGATVLSVTLDAFVTALAHSVERAVFPGRLIDGVRFVRTLGPYTVVCLELPHQVRTVQWLTDDSPAAFGPRAQYQQVRLAFPYIVVIVTFWDGALTGQQQLFYRSTPLKSADDTLCFPNLYNVADGYGQVCWVCLQKLRSLATVPWDEKLQAIVAHLWSAFNRSSEVHEGHSYWGKMRTLDRRLHSVSAWQKATAADPTFVLSVPWRATGLSIRQVMEKQLAACQGVPPLTTATDLAALLLRLR
jgi:hypothetical protein